MNHIIKRNGLIAAGVINIFGALGSSQFFTNSAINEADPAVMSNFGLLMIVIWGMAYIGASTIDGNIKWLALVFALEKLAYVAAWLFWLSGNELGPVFAKDTSAGIFFGTYGINDFVFMVFFFWLFFSEKAER
jgi:hypothetical protein